MKNFSILIEGVIDAPGETNADINAGIAKRLAGVAESGALTVAELTGAGAQVKSARLVVESRGGDHGPTEVVDLKVKDEPAATETPLVKSIEEFAATDGAAALAGSETGAPSETVAAP